MSRTRAFAVDTAVTTTFQIDATDGFTWGDAQIVQIDHPPHETAFDTDRFYKIPMTAARSVEQTYRTVDGDKTFVKPPSELRDAAWSLDNAPITLGHPATRIVDGVDKVHGFVRHPEWDAADEALEAYAYIPVTDTEAKAFVEDNDGVSIGFWYNADTTDTPPGVDGYQRDLLVDHVAIVDEGRCSREDGCGLAADVADDMDGPAQVVRAFHTDLGDGGCSDGPCACGLHADSSTQFSEGDWVRWSYSGGSAVGRVTTVATSGTLSVEGGSREASEDEPAYKMEHWDDGSFGNMTVKSESELNSAEEPADFEADAFGIDKSVEDIDLVPPEAAQDNAQAALDARDDDDVTVNGMTDRGWTRAETLASGDELDPSDLVEGQDGMAVWWSRHATDMVVSTDDGLKLDHYDADNPWSENSYTAGMGWGGIAGYEWAIRKGNEIKRARGEEPDYSVMGEDRAFVRDDTSTVAGVTFRGTREGELDESEIPNDDYESHYLYPADTKSDSSYPVVDADGYLRRDNVESAYQLGARGGIDGEAHDDKLRRLNEQFDDPPISPEKFEEDTHMSDGDGTDDPQNGGSPIDVGDLTVDAIAEENEAVAELTDEVDELEAQLDAATDELDSVKEELESYRADEKQELVDEITALTDTWDEDELMELELDTLEDRHDLAKDLAADVSGGVENDGANGGDNGGRGGGRGERDFGTDRDPMSGAIHGDAYDLSDTA
ncbi:HVA1 family protein [Halorubrum ezzemoulense]|uniref:HVA1 family protein n=1 Tax=Halorubrum ezzemoulense TaxID=337243 RepID=UPI00232BE603|nr:HVA1 family protein [Halorubrum ezzemoulense]MDB9247459.1 HVA1 family protein [Halorubrum ezzemoulense]MDB9258632.1 HVA1 family protein [Halorubrum ezzemoulense]MDB9264510.1 HVA1 family protein [Halorubrum ezzemoulense]MDB9268993.1 HVA1 family protein [Halorubrum ezzemoulense]MDB9271478.1 HVA1 family protein [Halorubrum ezzemoulense]